MSDFIKWYSNSTFKLKCDGRVIYIDPYKMNLSQYETADLVLITHDHFDHFSIDDIKKVSGEKTSYIAPFSCGESLPGNTKIVTAGDKFIEDGVEIEVVPAYNTNKEFHPKSYGGVGYIINANGKRIYHSGDTDLIPEMKSFKVDIALLAISGTYFMNPEEAAEAANLINAELSIPMHFGDVIGTEADAEKFKSLVNGAVKILKVSTS